jgi:hypothetical protein
MSKNSSYQLLIEKLDAFIRKFYLNKLIRGSIYFFSVLLITFLCLNTLEYFFYLKPNYKILLLSTSAIILSALLIIYILIPLVKYYKLGPVISHKKAAEIIGYHFSEVKDKLINILDLHEQSSQNKEHYDLIMAGINQKITDIKTIPFVKAIDFSKNKRYLKYVLIPFLFIVSIFIISPSFIESGSERLINYNTQFEKPAPFNFVLNNKNLSINQGDNILISLSISGNELPQDVYLHLEESVYKLEKKDVSNFEYQLQNIQANSQFYFSAAGYDSKTYQLEVIEKPIISSFFVDINYPDYTGRKDERLKNVGDISIPEGSIVSWNFNTQNLHELYFNLDKESILLRAEKDLLNYSRRIKNSSNYSIIPIHPKKLNVDTLKYFIDVTKDQSPSIVVEQTRDSINTKRFYFSGVINDDYGFNKLLFIYKQKSGDLKITNVPIQKSINSQRFYHYWEVDASTISDVDYYFEVYDNDAVNGSKKTRSQIMRFELPTAKEINKEVNKNSEQLKDQLKEAIKKSEQIQKDAKKLNEKLINQKSIRYEEKKQINDLIERQKDVESLIKDIQEQLKKSNQFEEDFKKVSPELLEKKKQLEELFENLLDEKTKNLIKELEKLLEQNNKELSQDQLQKMQLENKLLEKEMDRMLEMYKQMEFDQKLKENIDKLEQLSKEQEKLSEESKNKSSKSDDIKKKQDELNKEFNEVKKELQDLENKNKELESPEDFQNPKEETNDIQKDIDKANEELSKQNNKKASDAQKNAADKMKELSKKMKSMQMSGEAEELDLNIKALRQILDNLITASFNQEKTMEQIKKTSTNDPQYVALTLKQKNIRDDVQIIQDSLYALSKKVVQIKPFVNKELESINQQVAKSIEALAERKTNEAVVRQQYTMTAMNNLALLLSEILSQMQEEMNDKKNEGKPGAKPGKKSGKGQGQSISKMQEQLNKQIEELKNGQKSGQKPGQGQGQGKMSEQLAKMAAQQQAIRNALNQLEKEMNKSGQGGNSNQLNQLKKEMEKTETELYNKIISQETINRQKEIMTRLLEAEKAARERELDDKRESKSAQDNFDKPNLKFEEYKKEKMKELELIKTVPPGLDPYYKEKVNIYFKKNP